MARVRKYLLAGLVVLTPVLVTVYVLNVVFRFLEVHIGQPVNVYLAAHVTWLRGDQPAVAVLVGLLLTILLLLIVGFVSSTMAGRRAVSLGELVAQRTPLIGWVYGPTRQVVQMLFSSSKEAAFRRVVLVPLPSHGIHVMGFVTADQIVGAGERVGQDLVNVFVPFSPTPFTGILTMVPRAHLIELPYTVEQGLKMVISLGVLTPDNTRWETGESNG